MELRASHASATVPGLPVTGVRPVRCANACLCNAFLRDIADRKQATKAKRLRSEKALLFRTVLCNFARTERTRCGAFW
jgi:hypothetical protein